jgi:hypothetical protein
VTWHELTARYDDTERKFMRRLSAKAPDEARVLHEAKALLGARILGYPREKAVRQRWAYWA